MQYIFYAAVVYGAVAYVDCWSRAANTNMYLESSVVIPQMWKSAPTYETFWQDRSINICGETGHLLELRQHNQRRGTVFSPPSTLVCCHSFT